jgi:hypothetical protein
MKKRILVYITALAIIVTACAQSNPQPAETNSAAQPTKEVPTQQNLTSEDTSPPEKDGQPGCTVVDPDPTPDPTLQAIFPPPGDNEWTKGPKNAHVTIIEYGDFQ